VIEVSRTRAVLACVTVATIISTILASVAVKGHVGNRTVEDMFRHIDDSIAAIRNGRISNAKNELARAYGQYLRIRGVIENFDDALVDQINGDFVSLYSKLDNQDISREEKESLARDLRGKLLSATGEAGVGLHFIYRYSAILVFVISTFFASVSTILCKYSVDWSRLKEIQAEAEEIRREMREIRLKKKFKQARELETRLAELGEQVSGWTTEKQVIFLLVPYFLLWALLGWIYRGWVVAWVPLGMNLPLIGTHFGLLPWLIVTYFGSVIFFRQLLVREGW